jgi:hypothetical protein
MDNPAVVFDSQNSRACWPTALLARAAASAQDGGLAAASRASSRASSLEARAMTCTKWGPASPRAVLRRMPCSSSAAACSSHGRVSSGRLAVDSSRSTSPSLICTSLFAAIW